MSVRSGTAPLATEVGRDTAWAPHGQAPWPELHATSSDAFRQFLCLSYAGEPVASASSGLGSWVSAD